MPSLFAVWKPAATQEQDRDRDQFFVRVAERMGGLPGVDYENARRGDSALLETEFDPGELDDVLRMPPAEVRDLWPESVRSRFALDRGRPAPQPTKARSMT